MIETATSSVILPAPAQPRAGGPEVALNVATPVTIASVLDALEERYPMLCGTIRDRDTFERRVFIRYFACEEDIAH